MITGTECMRNKLFYYYSNSGKAYCPFYLFCFFPVTKDAPLCLVRYISPWYFFFFFFTYIFLRHLLDVEEHVGLLAENSPDVTDGHAGIVHLVPLAIAALSENTAGQRLLRLLRSSLALVRFEWLSSVWSVPWCNRSNVRCDSWIPSGPAQRTGRTPAAPLGTETWKVAGSSTLDMRHPDNSKQTFLLSHQVTFTITPTSQYWYVCGTFKIFSPLKTEKRFSERVSTLQLRWIEKPFLAVTIWLHLNKTTDWQLASVIKSILPPYLC